MPHRRAAVSGLPGLLAELAGCQAHDDYRCLDRILAGSELVTGIARQRLRQPSRASDPDTLPALRADAEAGGVRRYVALLEAPLGQCGTALSLAGEGLCHDHGAVHRPPPERRLAPGEARWQGALTALDRHLGAGLRHRRVHRLVCGPYAGLGGLFRYAEATVVVADRPGAGPTILDLACRALGSTGMAHQTPTALPAVPAAPDSAAVTTAVGRAIHCLEDGGAGCLDAIAPLDRFLHDHLARALDAPHDDRERALTAVSNVVTGDVGTRAGWLLAELHERCGQVDRLAADDCRAGVATPVPSPPSLPRRLGPSEAARVRALEALARARVPKGSVEARPIACGDLRATAILVRPKSGPPALVDLMCQ